MVSRVEGILRHTSPGGAPSTKAETVSSCEAIPNDSRSLKTCGSVLNIDSFVTGSNSGV